MLQVTFGIPYNASEALEDLIARSIHDEELDQFRTAALAQSAVDDDCPHHGVNADTIPHFTIVGCTCPNGLDDDLVATASQIFVEEPSPEIWTTTPEGIPVLDMDAMDAIAHPLAHCDEGCGICCEPHSFFCGCGRVGCGCEPCTVAGGWVYRAEENSLPVFSTHDGVYAAIGR